MSVKEDALKILADLPSTMTWDDLVTKAHERAVIERQTLPGASAPKSEHVWAVAAEGLFLALVTGIAVFKARSGAPATLGTVQSLMTSLTGFACGGLAGALFSPGRRERQSFAGINKILGAFISGYLISKLGAVYGDWFGPQAANTADHVFGLGLFTTAFVVGVFFVYTIRKYAFRAGD